MLRHEQRLGRAVSLAACCLCAFVSLGSIGLCFRAIFRVDRLVWRRVEDRTSYDILLLSCRGSLCLDILRIRREAGTRPADWPSAFVSEPCRWASARVHMDRLHSLGLAGFALARERIPAVYAADRWYFAVPLWLIAIIAATPVGLKGWKWWTRRRCANDSATVPCPRCCYDIRATPEQCPECGLVVGGKDVAEPVSATARS
jgi:hypothetical protein